LQQPPLVADEEETYEFKDDEIKTDKCYGGKCLEELSDVC
jgi:hypothetical protein